MSRRQRRRQEKQRRHAPREVFEAHPRGRRLAAGAGVTIGTTLAMGGVAQAACTCTVDSLADPTDAGHTTLRDAITSAETSANSGSTITFASGLTGTITLSSQLPTISYPTTIQGPGAGQLAISGDDAYRILYAHPGTPGAQVTISGLTLTGAHPSSDGGAILNQDANLTVASSVLTDNATGDRGAGIFDNSTADGGVTIESSTLSGNVADSFSGAFQSDNYGKVAIENSTIVGNHADGGAGGMFIRNPVTAKIENSTIYNNVSTGSGGEGGAIGTDGAGALAITGSTISGNQTAASGGGIYDYYDSTTVELRNTIVAGNTAAEGGPDLAGASPFSAAFSLIQDPAGATISETVPGSDITGVDPQLGPLQDNGGLTETMLPAAISPVIDKGSSFGLVADQRGLTRPVEIPSIPNSTAAGADGADIGAVEVQSVPSPPPTPTPTPTPNPAGPTGERAAALAKCKKKHKRQVQKKRAKHALTPQVKKKLKKKLRKCKARATQVPV